MLFRSQATCVLSRGDLRVYEKELEDGGRAVGFFNLGSVPMNQNLENLNQFGLAGRLQIRDLWRQKNLPDVDVNGGFLTLAIPAHGVVLCKLTTAKP